MPEHSAKSILVFLPANGEAFGHCLQVWSPYYQVAQLPPAFVSLSWPQMI